MQKCKICDGELKTILVYTNTPEGAQIFKKNIQKEDQIITLNICQCQMCGIVQIPINPVNYFKESIRSPDWNVDNFRVYQKQKFIQQFNLNNKKIVYVDNEPVPEKYDAFLMFNYLQHFPFPRKTLKQIFDNLSDNGVGIIEVPNFDQIIRDGIFGQFIIDHLFYFTKDTLKQILEISGFQVLRIQQIWEGASLSATVRKRNLLNVSTFINNQQKLIFDIDKYLQKYNKVVIWGASHQTLMMLPMLKNIDKVKYIIDDYKIKQYQYTPITNKLILPSQELLKDVVDAVIIIVGWQYKSVFNRIEKMNINIHKSIIKKATLEII